MLGISWLKYNRLTLTLSYAIFLSEIKIYMAVMGTKRETNQRSESGTYAGSAAVKDLNDTPEPTSEPF